MINKEVAAGQVLTLGFYLISSVQVLGFAPNLGSNQEPQNSSQILLEETLIDYPPAPILPTDRPSLDDPIFELFDDCLIIPEESWTGVGSQYSTEGCYGCGENQIMANGEKLNNNADTLAFWRLPLNSFVRVKNLTTNLSRKAKVTDRGGFDIAPFSVYSSLRSRLFDLSTGLAARLGNFETDKTPIEITHLDCTKNRLLQIAP